MRILIMNRFSGCLRQAWLILPISLMLSGCASLSEGQCKAGGWHQIGESDGVAGHPASRLASHREACAEYGIRPKEADYRSGHAQGLKAYCTPKSAVREGSAGRSYQGVCPPSIHGDFAELHGAAYAAYRARQATQSIDNEIEGLEREHQSSKTSAERRKQIRDELRRLERKLDRARDDEREKEDDLNSMTRRANF